MHNGILGAKYHELRRTDRAARYRLKRRTEEIIAAIKTFKGENVKAMLDVGTADGAMLQEFIKNLEIENAAGLDFSRELLRFGERGKGSLIQGDASNLPFQSNSFDIITAAALIEHVQNPERMLAEFCRVLRKKGICIITTPDPFFENIATKIGHLAKEDHVQTFNLADLRRIMDGANFEILMAEKFMLSPIGAPCDKQIERGLKKIKLEKLLLNQIIVGQKKEDWKSLSNREISSG